MNIILSDVSRYKGNKGTWKDVFKYYFTNPLFRVIFLHRLYHRWYHILSYLRCLWERVSSLFIISISVGNLVSNFLLVQKLEKGLSFNILVVLL